MSAPAPPAPSPSLLGRLFKLCWRCLILAIAVFVGINIWIPLSTQDRIYMDAQEVPQHEVAIVLGTSKNTKFGQNLHFRYRMEAAAALYKAGKVKWLLLSGDGERPEYNEPADMRESLRQLGVPAAACQLDPLGLRSDMTFSRAKREFGVQRAVIVSDDFHLPRCLLLADHYGIQADGFHQKAVAFNASHSREWLARIRMYGDFLRE